VRRQGPGLLFAPDKGGGHAGVEALVNLARFAPVHVRPVTSWTGSEASWPGVVSSLARHVIGPYAVPRFLASAWYAEGPYAEAQRRWFVAHAQGASFRSLDLPIAMTRRMEHRFLASPDHLDVARALRRAELIALGAGPALVTAVLATRVGADLGNGAFWRTAWRFLIAHSSSLDLAQVGPIVDFLQAIRHERTTVETIDGPLLREPPQPTFSLRGRSLASVIRLMDEWHRGLGLRSDGYSWPGSRQRPLFVEEPAAEPARSSRWWEVVELTTSEQLRVEGAALQHCVASYAGSCWGGASRIWSMRVRGERTVRSLLTIQVDPRRNAIVQARGFRNRPAGGKALEVLRAWAERERLRLSM
jgi:hypothetical protein